MNRRKVYSLAAGLGAATALSLALVFAILPLGSNDTSSSGVTAEGIEVHGHWVIEVRDPDGKIVDRREFDNALTDHSILPEILAHQRTVGYWEVELRGSPLEGFNGPCLTDSGEPFICSVAERNPSNSGATFPTLTVSVDDTDNFNKKLALSGTMIAQRNSDISAVTTRVRTCPVSVTTQDCATGIGTTHVFHVTGTRLPSPVDVLLGQEIQVTVTIEFF